uniref:BRICHOS domain containing 5 n=1 Tax=Amphilophus citrinellus TaxID=61819 RepID=A0A3Q0QZS9_AMPCI
FMCVETCSQDGAPEASPWSHFPHKAFWVGLSASLLLVILALGLMGHFGRSQPHSQSLQTVRFTVPDQIGALINQSAVVDQQNELVTFSVTSPINRTSTVLFDIKHSLICYKPIDQESCFLRKMEESDYANVNSLLHESTPKVEGRDMLHNIVFLLEPLQALCQDRSVHWTRRTEGEGTKNLYLYQHLCHFTVASLSSGPGKQRLVYFCIDICFPSNICVSVCFYYLPE